MHKKTAWNSFSMFDEAPVVIGGASSQSQTSNVPVKRETSPKGG